MKILALSLIAGLLSTGAQASENDAETCLRAKVWEGYADGWGIRTLTTATLQRGATKNYLVTLYKGNEYQIRSCADTATQDLDLLLYDINGSLVMRDENDDGREPSLTFTPEATATYYIVVHAQTLADGQSEAGAAMAVTYK